MAETLRKGAKVKWHSSGGTAHGKVVRKVTKPMKIKDHKVAASPDDPQILVETDSRARAAHKPEALEKE